MPRVKYRMTTMTRGARKRTAKAQGFCIRRRPCSPAISCPAALVPHTQPTKRQKHSAPRGIIRLSVNFSITAFIGSICSPFLKSNQGRLMPRPADWERE